MRWMRFFLFLLAILVGAGAGVAYGWVINPPEYGGLAPSTLYPDYKADYVLMVAEIYGQEGNLPQALRRLSQLEPGLPPARTVAEALLRARDLDYDPIDLERMAALAKAVQSGEAIETDTGAATPAPTPSASSEAQP